MVLKVLRIPKRNGEYRFVVCPSGKKKKELRAWIPMLQSICFALDDREVMQGFLPMRSPVTNAKKHIGFRYSVCFDLESFFDHVDLPKLNAVSKGPGSQGWSQFLWRGIAAQGLPTSPLLANIAGHSIDKSIIGHIDRFSHGAVYTRYADDLTISTNDKVYCDMLLEDIPDLCEFWGFPVNNRKTKLQAASAGRRIVTGVAVDDSAVYPTRAVKRRLRAAKHQNHKLSEHGLEEWMKLKEPSLSKLHDKLIEIMAKKGRTAMAGCQSLLLQMN